MKTALHVSWIVMVTCLGIVIGVIAAAHVPHGTFSQLVWLLVGCGLCLVAMWRQKRWCIALAFIGGVLIGLVRGGHVAYQLTVWQNIIGTTQSVSGVVTEDPGVDKNDHPTYTLKDISIDNHALPGKIWIDMGQATVARRSDRLTVRGMVSEGFANYGATMYRARVTQITRQTHADPALEIRDAYAAHVQSAIDEPASSLGLGVLVGEKRALPRDVAESFRIASLTHIVVASGYNLTILVRLARRLFARVSKFLAMAVTSGLVISFMAVTGLSPSMSRAGLVAFLALAAWYYGRRFHPAVLLSFAAAVTLLVEPSYGWNDLGWSLSFASFAGVMILAPVLQTYFFGTKKPGTIRQILGETLSAQIATLPLIVLSFGYVSLVGVLANLLIVPFVPLSMLLTFIAGIGAWVFPPLASVFGWPAEQLLGAMIWLSQWFSRLPWARVEATWGPIMAVGFYCCIAVGWVWLWRASRTNLYQQSIVE